MVQKGAYVFPETALVQYTARSHTAQSTYALLTPTGDGTRSKRRNRRSKYNPSINHIQLIVGEREREREGTP